MSHFSYDQVEDFGLHVLQEMADTMRDMINDKCRNLAKQAKQGEFDEWAALATRDIFEMRRVIRECEVLQGDITGCLSNWLEKREQSEAPNVEVTGAARLYRAASVLTDGMDSPVFFAPNWRNRCSWGWGSVFNERSPE